MNIIDLDKVKKSEGKFLFKGEIYLIKEPTVQAWIEIKGYNFEENLITNFKESIEFLCEKMCPELKKELKNMVNSEINMVFNTLLNVLSQMETTTKEILIS